ncbi:MAG: hypothetical protein E7Z62_05495 [Thermoplasmata archaeon]|nr:hypothetical protein [Thermoplasmata archaeon]
MFRFTRYDRMRNDETEGNYVYSLFADVCEELRSELGDDLYEALKTVSSDESFRASFNYFHGSEDAIPYVSCFTLKESSDILRDRYSSDITIKMEDLQSFPDIGKRNEIIGDHLDVHLVRVIYGTDHVKDCIRSALRCAHEHQPDIDRVVLYMRQTLAIHRLFIKDSFFEDEAEVRVIVFVPTDLHDRPDLESVIPKSIKTNHNGRLIDTAFDFRPGDDYLFLPFDPPSNINLIRSDRVTDFMISSTFAGDVKFSSFPDEYYRCRDSEDGD